MVFLYLFYRSVTILKYVNARTILPEKLLNELQKYIQGDIVYVPGNNPERAGWGASNGAKEKYRERNTAIINLYNNGKSIDEIAQMYYLSEYSIKKIINKHRGTLNRTRT